MKRTFLHELSQPLTAIGNFTAAVQLIVEHGRGRTTGLSPSELVKVADCLEQVMSQIERIRQMIHEQQTLEAHGESSE